jgi:large subunit ribosomal protein L6
MSRIGKKIIDLPAKVKVSVSNEGAVSVEGPKGKLDWTLPKQIQARIEGSQITIERSSENRNVRALHGLSRALINNMVTGTSTGFVKDLEIQGVGFKAAVKGAILDLNLGFSHDIHFPIPQGIKVTVAENTKIKIEGIDRQLVGQVAADIRAYYPPEPYKGKGVRYAGEQIQRKEGKTVQ